MTNGRANTVLVVDDDALARAALVDVYRSVGMAVAVASDVPAFFAELSRWVPDLCVVDIVLPGATGLAAIGEVRSRPDLARTALVGLSAKLDPALPVLAFQSGADDFLFKPFSGEELVARSLLAIERRRQLAPLGGIRGNARRNVTTLFCDVRGFTQLAAAHDPEWVVEVLNGLFERLVEHVHARRGEVDKYLGDGLLAFFGASGDGRDKELHAIEAALAMVASTEDYSRESLLLSGRKLSLGIGIATGEVVIAPVGGADKRVVTAIGDSVNLASRLQAIAAEGEVLVCEQTYQKVANAVLTPGGRHVELKGIAGVPTVYPVSGTRPEGWLR